MCSQQQTLHMKTNPLTLGHKLYTQVMSKQRTLSTEYHIHKTRHEHVELTCTASTTTRALALHSVPGLRDVTPTPRLCKGGRS